MTPAVVQPASLDSNTNGQPNRPVTTRGIVEYMKEPAPGEELFQYIYETPGLDKPTNLEFDSREVTVTDVRAESSSLSLAKNGFELHKLTVPGDIDWENKEEVKERYYPLVQDLLRKVTGASRVNIFDHTLRKGHITGKGKLDDTKKQDRQPVGKVHVDYTVDGGVKRLGMVFPYEFATLSKTPFAIVQAWRPLKGPVKSSPLGMIDATTVAKKDLLYYKVHFPGRVGSNYGLKYNPDHKWVYAHEIKSDEVYVFVCYDSRSSRARFTPHTGFRDLSAGPDAPPRESIEIRSFCFWENQEPQEYAKSL